MKRLLNMKATQYQYNFLLLKPMHCNNSKQKNMKKHKHKSNTDANHDSKNKILRCAPASLQTFSCFYTRRGRLSRSEVDPAAPNL